MVLRSALTTASMDRGSLFDGVFDLSVGVVAGFLAAHPGCDHLLLVWGHRVRGRAPAALMLAKTLAHAGKTVHVSQL